MKKDEEMWNENEKDLLNKIQKNKITIEMIMEKSEKEYNEWKEKEEERKKRVEKYKNAIKTFEEKIKKQEK